MSHNVRILRRGEVCERVNCSPSTIDRLEAARQFPQRVQLSPYTVGWVEAEVTEWVEERMRARAGERRIGDGRPSKRHPPASHAPL
ncbi:AlpA family phage regulatory protein [Lysobacter arenosi]|uniref:AlpA family phage regulatory protein n=1 Tax=Lysobacter arenosi TaxID=2795387 RepID=A0ABX7RFA4_9GAMM|nr:AlpA family phage regulatory protein [Lysobacter arenosi]QSX75612.1 AlpA family phage regulatory protein [Lysobacter arenosi]